VDIRLAGGRCATVGSYAVLARRRELRQHHADLIISMTVDLAQVLAE